MNCVIIGKPINAPQLIGIAGPAGVGKDTLAQFIHRTYTHRVRAYADPIKELLMERFKWKREHLEDRHWKESIHWSQNCGPFSPRSWMQWLGTDVLRKLAGDDIFIRLAFKDWDRARFPLVLSDIRFDNEAEAVIQRGGIVIGLRRQIEPVLAHRSETHIPYRLCHNVIVNDRSIEDMCEAARGIIEAVGDRLALQHELDLAAPQ